MSSALGELAHVDEMAPSKGDRAKAGVLVSVTPDVAFEVFTQEIDLWWKRGPQFRFGGKSPGTLHFEPGVGGRLFESFGQGAEARVQEAGRIKVWEPPERLVFEWRNSNFAPAETTEVEVHFSATAGGTFVTVEHRGWATLRPGHPARHGLEGTEHSGRLGLWWGQLLSSLREYTASKP
jgi:uncharacterized protein YndB with AHSA1/START domain